MAIQEQEISMRSGQKYVVREIREEDAMAMIGYLEQVAKESDNLTFGPGELKVTVEEEAAFIKRAISEPNQYMAVAEYDGRIIACLNFVSGTKPRLAHIGEFGISVIKEFWGNGIAYKMLKGLVVWAKEGGYIRKINLEVRVDNEKAITLYKNLGFENEGLVRRRFFINDEFIDAYHMGMLID